VQRHPDRAGFVPVMQGRTSDPQRAQQQGTRPGDVGSVPADFIGTVEVGYDDGAYTEVMYFSPEAVAHSG
jgi:hypothetical protein